MWAHTDAPEAHPLWEQQVNLERGMMRAGADRFRDAVIEAEKRGNMTRLKPVRALLEDWLPEIASTLKGWLRDMGLARGVKPIAYTYLKPIDPALASLVALRAVLDGVTAERTKLTPLAIHIGRELEHELKVRLWEDQDPELFQKYERQAEIAGSTATHIRKVNISRFNALRERGGVEWTDWSEEAAFRVGVALLEVIIRKTGWFETQEDPNHVYKKGSKNNRAPLVLAAKEGMLVWLAKAFDHAELNQPQFKPTVMPPKRWQGGRGGGYWTPYIRTPKLVRFKASQENQKDAAADEYDAIDMPAVYEALHHLQDTAWCVNRKVLDVVSAAWAADMQIAGLPRLTEEKAPVRPPLVAAYHQIVTEAREKGEEVPKPDPETDAAVFKWKREAIPVYRRNAKRVAHTRSTSETVRIALEYAQYERFYFPHMLDFRGRMYPIPAFLQPQGNDLARGLLAFADGVPVTQANGGGGWLAIALATGWGFDKASLDERIAWVEEREELWRRIAADPLANLEWADEKKVSNPWQALAAIFEWVAYLDTGEGFVSNLPVMVDGTCNGIQHLSAMTRDEVSGSYVNLTPANRPRDIYKFVAESLQETLEGISKAGGPEGVKADYWLDLCNGDLPRTLTKRQVMVLPYGGSRTSFYQYTRAWLDEHDPKEGLTDEEREERNGFIGFLVGHLWDACNRVVEGGMKVMKWLQDCAKVACEANQPIFWITPTGFVVRHFYGLVKTRQVDIKLDGSRFQLALPERTKDLSIREQLQGIAPNYIHSLDAACLMESLAMAKEQGIDAFASIHDAYGTHAGNMWPLFRLLREAFVRVHERDVLGEFRQACSNVLVALLVETRGMDVLDAADAAEEMLPMPLPKGSLDLSLVRQSDYFFA